MLIHGIEICRKITPKFLCSSCSSNNTITLSKRKKHHHYVQQQGEKKTFLTQGDDHHKHLSFEFLSLVCLRFSTIRVLRLALFKI